MAKYINKDQAYKVVLHYGSYVASSKIAEMPSIDLIRCGECKVANDCAWNLMNGDPNWFCANGERKEAEHE